MSENSSVARAFAALGHDARLSIYRLLVKAGPEGLTVGQISGHLKLAASTLAHHLRTLVDAGLVTQSKHGREVVSTANFDEMNHIVEFLTENCCTGVQNVTTDTAA